MVGISKIPTSPSRLEQWDPLSILATSMKGVLKTDFFDIVTTSLQDCRSMDTHGDRKAPKMKTVCALRSFVRAVHKSWLPCRAPWNLVEDRNQSTIRSVLEISLD